MSQSQQLLSPAELVARWGNAVTLGTLANWRSNKTGPSFQKIGARVRYPLDAVQAYEASRRVASNDEATANASAATQHLATTWAHKKAA